MNLLPGGVENGLGIDGNSQGIAKNVVVVGYGLHHLGQGPSLRVVLFEPPRPLREQLAPGGRLVLPLGASEQSLTAVDPEGTVVDTRGGVRFTPLLVEGEQAGGIERNRTAREERERAVRAAERRRGWEQEWIDWDDAAGRRF